MTLGNYIEQLVAKMRESEPDAYDRLRRVIGSRKALIQLDAERVAVQFHRGRLRARPVIKEETADGEGWTDHDTVLDLLDARLEASQAIDLGRVEVRGTPDNVNRILSAIDILIDVSTRTPSMQELSERFRAEFSRSRRLVTLPLTNWYPFPCSHEEYDMLSRLDLLPDKESS